MQNKLTDLYNDPQFLDGRQTEQKKIATEK